MTFNTENNTFKWNPNYIIENKTEKYAAILLNHALDYVNENDRRIFENVWENALLRVCADGGTNSLRKSDANPHIICGDFDSINNEILNYYKSLNDSVKVISTPEQDSTDFTKSVQLVLKEVQQTNNTIDYVIVFWSSSGRIDNILANIYTLYKFNQTRDDTVPLFLFNIGQSLSWLLKMGSHTIKSRRTSKWCSLVPVSSECRLTTKGFRWNLNNDILSFGTFISTSNGFDRNEDTVAINCDNPILFSMEMS